MARITIVAPPKNRPSPTRGTSRLKRRASCQAIVVTKLIVLFPNAINDVADSWLPRWVEVVDLRTIEQHAKFDVVVIWGLIDRTSHLTCPMIDVQHGAVSAIGLKAPTSSAIRATMKPAASRSPRRGSPAYRSFPTTTS